MAERPTDRFGFIFLLYFFTAELTKYGSDRLFYCAMQQYLQILYWEAKRVIYAIATNGAASSKY